MKTYRNLILLHTCLLAIAVQSCSHRENGAVCGENAVEFSQATEQTTDTVRPSADPAATHTIQVPAHTYKAVQPEGIAFPSGSLSDDRYFTVCLPRQPQQEETVCLEYTLEGLSGAMPLALSINNSPAVGGYSGRINADPATASQQYRIPFPSGKFHSGENRLRFHLPAAAGADYRIRDLQVKVEADKQPAHRHITRHITLYPVSVCEQSLYLAGFIRRDTGQYGELTLSFAGKTIPVHDGEFEAMIPLSSFPPSAIREQLYVTGKDGRRDSISIDVIPSGKPDYSIPFREKESPVSLALDALHAGELHLGEAGLTVPDSSLAQPAVFSITALRSTDLPAMDPGLVNVTAGEGGYRFLPHGKHFAHRPATVHLPYDDRLFPEGYTAADVRTFYFDEQHFKWIALPKDSLLESNHVLASLTTHFTDMINGILKVPETPVTGAYTPTTVTGLKAADPSADVQLMQAPQATHTGHAAIHYPLIIPPGRAGLQPSLHLSYSSEGGNGWLGNAWDLSLPVLSVETRWGAPLYLADRESESYLMEGSQLTPLVQFQQDFLPREAEKRFYPRVEGSYSQIVRHGDRPDNYWWEVTSTSGLKHYYGGKPGAGVMAEAVLKDANGNIGEWRLVEMRDVNDNFIAFHYALQQDNINGLTAANLYPDHILYTGHGSEEGRYRINFIRRTSPRSDVSSNARMGFLVAESQLLDKVEVLYENELYGACQFHYSAKAFGKTFLDSLVILDSESRRTYSHVLEYYNEIDPAGFYSDEVVINTGNESAGSDAGFINSIKGFRDTPTALGSSKSSGYSAGGSFGAGAYGFLVGGSYSASRNSGEGLVSLMDINGDAIPDKIYKKGRSLYYRPGVAGSALFGTEQLLRGAPEDFSATSSSSSASGINITAIVVTTSYSDTDSKSETSVYLTDFNRDGLPDIAFKGEVYFNHIENGHPVFEKGSLNTPVPIGKSDLDASLIVNDNAAEQAELILKNPLHDIVRLWEAPFDGTVTIEAPVRLLPATDSLAYGFDKRDGVDLRIEHRETLQWSARIGAEDFSVKDCRLENIAVTRGEQIYFRVHSIENGVDDRVEWAPSITYTQITGKASGRNNLPADIPLDGKDINDEPYKSYDARRDFIFAINEPFPLAKTGSVVLESYFEKPVTTDQLHLRASIKDSLGVTTVLMDTLLMGDETWADSLNFNLEVTAKSELSLSLYSPSRIDYSNIHWESVLTYTSIPNAESENGFEPISDRDGRLLYRDKVPVNYTLYDKRLSFALPYTYQHDSCAVVQILPLIAVKNAPTASGNLRMVIKSEHKPEHFVTRDYTFDRYNPQWTDITRQYLRPNSGDTLSLTVEKGDRFHVEYYGDSLAFLSNIAFPGYTFAAYADTLHFLRPDPDPDKDTSYLEVHFVCPPIQTDSLLFADSLAASLYTRVDDSSYGLLHRGWGQFSYNANGDRAGRCIRKSELDADIAKRNTLAQTIGSLSEEDQQNPDIIRSLTEGNRMYNALFAMTPASLMSPEYRYTGYDAAVYVQDSILSASRMGEKEIRLPAWDVSGSSFPAYPKRYRSSGNSLSVGSVYGISMNHSSSDSRFEMEVMDLNGDGFPDLMTPTAITYTSPAGSLSNLAALKRDHALGNGLASSSGSGLGINAGSAVESVMNTFRKKGNGGNSNAADAGGATASDAGKTAQKSVSLSGNFSNSEDYTQAEFIDINGDGLPDKAFRNGTVALNLGYSFTAPIPWGAGLTGGSSKDFGGGLGVSVNAFSFSASTGFGLSRTEGESRIGMLDLNGDGLPDRVSNGGVSFNTGTGFLAETPWHSPSSQHSESVGESVNASFQYTFTIPILVVVVNFSVGVEGSTQHGLSRDMTQLRDMNGDGYADIVTADGADKLKVRYAQPGKTYLLKKVINPLGNTFSLDYSATTPTYEDPTHRWRLDRVTLFDGHAGDGVDTLRTAFDYETPHHDRKERTFLGYAKVTSKQLDTANGDTPYRSSIQEYDNTSIYTRGILKTEQTVDASSQLLSLRENSYRYLDATDHSREITAAALPHQTGSIFIALDETTVYSYENAVAIGTATKNEYDAYGNIVRHIDTGSGTPADKVQVDIIYRHDPARYLHALPETVSVSTQEGIIRQRTAQYDDRGRLTRHTSLIGDNTEAVYDFEYDAYGNITQVIRPENYRGQRFRYAFTYDDKLHSLPVAVEDAFGYRSTTSYNYKFAVPTATTDPNGQEIRYTYDARGRLASVTAPSEIRDGAPYTIRHEYHPEAATPYAVTAHYQGNGLPDIMTYTFIDGLSRSVQIKKSSTIYNDTTGIDENKLTVSGKIIYDAFGRKTTTYLPIAEDFGSETVFNAGHSPVTPTFTEYDAKDRPVKVTLPDGSTLAGAFEIVTDNGIKLLKQTQTDAENNRTESYTDVRERTIQTIRKSATGDVAVRFRYNPLGELLETIDPKGNSSIFTYDRLGRKLTAHHPDAGLTSYEYDRAGNLLYKQTPNLKAIGPDVKIKYTYDYERPFEIVYPKNIQQRVTYSYGAPQAAHNRAGRLWLVQDATGSQEFFFDALGNVEKTIRTVMTNPSEMRTYVWSEAYDSWNRIRSMTYPDGETVTYTYNASGQLASMAGKKEGRDYAYIDRLGYDLQGRTVYQRLGNGTETRYSYEEERQRLETMQLTSGKTNTRLLDLLYGYDKVDNILSLTDHSPKPEQSQSNPDEILGGPFRHNYRYDDLYRLIHAEGEHYHTDTASYVLDMDYDLMGSPLRKSQAITLGTDSVSPHSMDVSYSYTHTKPNAASWIGNLNLLYDKNGNLESRTDTATNDYRRFLWNEDNQLLGVEENGYISRYTYDAQGERIVKAHGGMQGVFINGAPAASIIRAENITVYVSPFITVNGNRFTKHYYAGTKRIASKIGNGQFNNKYTPENRIILAGNVNAIDRYNQIEGSRAEYIRQLGVPPGPPTMKGIYGEPEFTGSLIPDGGTPTNAAPANWPRKPIQAPPGGPPGAPVQFGPDITNETVAGGFGFVTTGHVEETDQYFYHSDHLGSSAYITDRQGKVSQFVVYLPFGEALIDSHANPDVMPYKFNGKEKDEETGLYYYGARYYNGDDQVWMGVDPLWEKYPGVSPYVYCLNNPVKLVDPDGRNPGDFFRTVTAAVKDFGNYYNGASIIRGTEFGSTIYSIKSNGKSGYTYTEADIGENDNVRPSAPLEGKTSVAWAHTHGKYEEGYLNNDFSSSDKWYSYNHGIDGYVVTPDGSLKKYDVETTNVSTVSTDMPSDPNDPGRKNENKPVDVPMKKEREQTTMEQNKKPELKIPETQKTNIEWAF